MYVKYQGGAAQHQPCSACSCSSRGTLGRACCNAACQHLPPSMWPPSRGSEAGAFLLTESWSPSNISNGSRQLAICMRKGHGQLSMLYRDTLRHSRMQWLLSSHLLQHQARTTAAQPGPAIRGKEKVRRISPRRTRSTNGDMLRRYLPLLRHLGSQPLRLMDLCCPDSCTHQVFACLIASRRIVNAFSLLCMAVAFVYRVCGHVSAMPWDMAHVSVPPVFCMVCVSNDPDSPA